MARVVCCYQCPNRYVGCHAKCTVYQEARKAADKLNQKIAYQKWYNSLTYQKGSSQL